MASVVVADPNFLAREGFKKIIENKGHISLSGEIIRYKDFWPKLTSLKPDILVLDYNAKDFFEKEDLGKICQLSPGTKILIISDSKKRENILTAVENGAIGYLTKQCGENEILDALNAVLKGEKYFCSKILDIIIEKKLEENNGKPVLTEREIEIIKLITEKYTNEEIAKKLFISINTVYTHRKNIMKKLKLKSPVELILYAIDSGIIQPYQN